MNRFARTRAPSTHDHLHFQNRPEGAWVLAVDNASVLQERPPVHQLTKNLGPRF